MVYIKAEGDKTRGRERYLVVDVKDDCCTLQKFVKSQLRAKKYQLNLTEVFPVSQDVIEIPGRIRDLVVAEDVDEGEEQVMPTTDISICVYVISEVVHEPRPRARGC